jgi:hypothetical protein
MSTARKVPATDSTLESQERTRHIYSCAGDKIATAFVLKHLLATIFSSICPCAGPSMGACICTKQSAFIKKSKVLSLRELLMKDYGPHPIIYALASGQAKGNMDVLWRSRDQI